MSVDEAIKAVELALQDLKAAALDLQHAAESEFNAAAPDAILALKRQAAQVALGPVRVEVAEKRRPKGPTATLEWSRGGKDPIVCEVIRRTATQVMLLRPGWRTEDVYKLESGFPAKRSDAGFIGYWRVRAADLESIRAMPVGENAVSRALKAIEKGSSR